MSNVRYECPVPGCQNAGFLPPDTNDDHQCPRHKDTEMVQVEFTQAVIDNPGQYLSTNVIPAQPTSIDASPDGMKYRIGDVQGAYVSDSSMPLALTNTVTEEEREEFMANFHGQDFSEQDAEADRQREKVLEREDATRTQMGSNSIVGQDGVGGHASKADVEGSQNGDVDSDDGPDDPELNPVDDEGGADTETIEHLPGDDDVEGWRRLYRDRNDGQEPDGRLGVRGLKRELGYDQ